MNKLIEFVTGLLKIKRVSTAIIVATGILSLVIIFVTIYATQVGNFVIRSNGGDMELYISEYLDENSSPVMLKDPQSILQSKGVKDMNNTTLDRIDVDSIINGNGNVNTLTSLGYTFFIQNQSGIMINYNIRMIINSSFKRVDEACWILVIENRNGIENRTVYAREQTVGENVGKPEDCLGFETTPFRSLKTIFDYNVLDVRNNEIIKYTFVFWLEGEDPQCVNDIFGGSLRCELEFTGYSR